MNTRGIYTIRLLTLATVAMVLAFSSSGETSDSAARPAVASSPTALLTAHDCTNPDNPTHAVVTIDGRSRYVGQRLTDRAIEQAVFGIDHGLIVHGFCR